MNYPLIPVTIALVMGILSADILQTGFTAHALLASIFLAATLLIFRWRREFVYIPVLAASFFLGAARHELEEQNQPAPLFLDYFIRDITIHGTVSSCELPASGNLSFSVKLDSVTGNGKTFFSGSTLLVSMYEDSSKKYNGLKQVKPGDKVVLGGNYYRFRSQANPYAFNEEFYYRNQGYAGRFRVTKPDSAVITGGSGYYYERMVHQVRKSSDSLLNSTFSADTYALLRGLLLADRSEIDIQTRKEFRDAGVIHVLAVSGLHMGFIAFLFSLIFTRLGLVKRDIGTIAGVIFFLAVTGFVITATRAGIMIILYLIGRIWQKDPDPVHTVFTAAMLILLWNPFEIYTAGFQLSFSAVLGILFYIKPLGDTFRVYKIKSSFLKATADLMLVSAAAQAGIFPFLLYHFGSVSLISPLSNLIVIPLTALIMSGGLLSAFLAVISGGTILFTADATEFLNSLLTGSAAFFAGAGFMIWKVEQISVPLILLFMGLAWLIRYWLTAEEMRYQVRIILTLLTMSSVFFIARNSGSIFEQGKLDVLFLDVGQGDAVLVSTPGGEKWLIDGGMLNKFSSAGEYRIMPFLERTMIDRIDYALLSHYDSDHYGGIAVLLKEGRIGTLIMPPEEPGEGSDDALRNLALINNTRIITATDTVIHSGGAAFCLMTPPGELPADEKKSNERSISLKLVYGKTAFLFTGDAPVKTERNLVEKFGGFLDADIFKAGHHGSKSSTGVEILAAASPEYVVFSSSPGNRYNHPAEEVLQRVKDSGSMIARTDREGAQLFTSDGSKVHKRVWK